MARTAGQHVSARRELQSRGGCVVGFLGTPFASNILDLSLLFDVVHYLLVLARHNLLVFTQHDKLVLAQRNMLVLTRRNMLVFAQHNRLVLAQAQRGIHGRTE